MGVVSHMAGQTAEEHGADDAESLLQDYRAQEEYKALLNGEEAPTAQESATSLLAQCDRSASEPDDALINAIGWDGVMELARVTDRRATLVWCTRYNAGFRAYLAKEAQGDHAL